MLSCYSSFILKDIEDIDKLVPWDPKLIVMNIDGSFTLDRKTYDVHFHEQGCKYPVVMQLWRFKGFFKENLELEHFPVDVQVFLSFFLIFIAHFKNAAYMQFYADFKNLEFRVNWGLYLKMFNICNMKQRQSLCV